MIGNSSYPFYHGLWQMFSLSAFSTDHEIGEPYQRVALYKTIH